MVTKTTRTVISAQYQPYCPIATPLGCTSLHRVAWRFTRSAGVVILQEAAAGNYADVGARRVSLHREAVHRHCVARVDQHRAAPHAALLVVRWHRGDVNQGLVVAHLVAQGCKLISRRRSRCARNHGDDGVPTILRSRATVAARSCML